MRRILLLTIVLALLAGCSSTPNSDDVLSALPPYVYRLEDGGLQIKRRSLEFETALPPYIILESGMTCTHDTTKRPLLSSQRWVSAAYKCENGINAEALFYIKSDELAYQGILFDELQEGTEG